MKLRNIFTSVMLAAASAFTGCSEDIDSPDTPDVSGEGNVTITLSCAKPGSRSADDKNNEDVISTLFLFFYPKDADPDVTEPVYYTDKPYTFSNTNESTQIKLSLSKKQIDTLFPGGNNDECRLVAIANISATQQDVLPEKKTINALRHVLAGGTFGGQNGTNVQRNFVMFGDTHENPVRSGTVPVKYTENSIGGSAEGKVMLVRAAAKIILNVNVSSTVDIKDEEGNVVETWRSLPVVPNQQDAGMYVTLENMVVSSYADPSVMTERPSSGLIESVKNQGFKFTDIGAGNAYPYQQIMPFYTYPNRWENNRDENYKTSMTLVLHWQKEGETSYRTCYYTVPVTPGTELLRNTAYTVNLQVGMLGSFIKEQPLEVRPTYYTVDWGEAQSPVYINNYRYLVLNQNSYVMDNQESITIPFYSSHPVTVNDITMTFKRFSLITGTGVNSGQVVDLPVSMAQNHQSGVRNTANANDSIFSYKIKDNGKGNYELVIKHPLKIWTAKRLNNNGTVANTITTSFNSTTAAQDYYKNTISFYQPPTEPLTSNDIPYSPYVFNVTIRHTDQSATSAFADTLRVTQYPGMWILADKNPYTTTGPGYTYVNNQQRTYQGNPNLGNVNGLGGSSSNANPNMYVITINTLSSTDANNYIVDDPRYFSPMSLNDDTGNNALTTPAATTAAATATWSASANAIYQKTGNTWGDATANRRLQYYYPTNESSEYSKVVAPKIRVASSYGVCSTGITRANARRRCASYQEAGRPAGRWRIPTFGEMQFIVNLSRAGKIPTLFSDGYPYWSAQGPVTIVTNGDLSVSNTTPNNMSVRCVYDEWYWEKYKPAEKNTFSDYYSTFTWGDREKENPEATN